MKDLGVDAAASPLPSVHTPGPWHIAGKATIRTAETWIADVFWRNRDANARLIAAAPDLLAALEKAQAFIRYDSSDYMPSPLQQIDAAIAKAEGR